MKEIVKLAADKTTNYIISLPNGTNTTVYDAAMAVCPDEIEQMEFMDLFDLFYAVLENVEKTDIVLDMSGHDNKEEGLFFKMDFYVYQKRLQKAQIISDMLCYGPVLRRKTRLSRDSQYRQPDGYGFQRGCSDIPAIITIPLEERYRWALGRNAQLRYYPGWLIMQTQIRCLCIVRTLAAGTWRLPELTELKRKCPAP